MKKSLYMRPLIAGLSLAMVSAAAFAHGKGDHHRDGDHRHGKMHGWESGDRHGSKGMRMGRGMMLQLPSELVEQLKLTDAQKIKYFDAQTTSTAMRDATREQMRQARDARKGRDEANAPFDPHAMFEQQNERFAQFQAARVTVQKQWLAFWDSLTTEQKGVVQEHFQSREKDKDQRKDKGKRN